MITYTNGSNNNCCTLFSENSLGNRSMFVSLLNVVLSVNIITSLVLLRKDTLMSTVLTSEHDSVFALFICDGSFSLCCRLSVMSSWLGSVCNLSASRQTAPGHIQAIAAVIWHAKETDSESTVSQHFSEELFRCVPVRFFSVMKNLLFVQLYLRNCFYK